MSTQFAAILAFLRRFPFASTCVLLTIGFGVGAWFLSQDVDEQELARQDRAKEGEAMLDLLVGASTQRQELGVVQEAASRIEGNLIVEADTADNNWYFYKIEEQTKSRVLEIHPQSAPGNDGSSLFKRIPYTLRIGGTYEQVIGFILALESGPRLASVTAFSLSRGAGGSGTLSLELSFEMLGKK